MPDGESVFISAPDGLKLHARCYGPRASNAVPVICLPGLARTAADFEVLAGALATDGPQSRRVIAIDYRGRGRSDYDRNPANYNVAIELADVVAIVTALDAMPAVFVGTSRGGLLIMLLAVVRPAAIAGAVLNDIGPAIEPQGLMRIKGYVGKLPQPSSFEDAAQVLRRLFGGQFPKLTAQDWLRNAQRTFKEKGGRLVPTYDPNLARTLDAVTPETQLPALWQQFDALAGRPVMVVRGGLSDILSADTVAAMRTRRQSLEVMEINDQGHAPLLSEPDTMARICDFVRRCARP